jgi:FtsH-binding integral membrane protein
MKSMENTSRLVAQADPIDAAQFYRKTYGLVALAFVAFAGLLYLFFKTPVAELLMTTLGTMYQSNSIVASIIVMLVFWAGTYYAQKLASNGASRESQYAGLGLYVLLQALIFIPLLVLVAVSTKHNVHGSMLELIRNFTFEDVAPILVPACALTVALVLGLTLAVQFTQVDFSFLRIVIVIGLICAIGASVVFTLLGFTPGTWFALAMILLMATVILYQTHVIKNNCSTDDYVIAAFILFSAFVTLLWYVIQFFMGRRSE